MSEKKEMTVLNTIETREAWEVLKKLIEEQKDNQTMPADIREVFFTQDKEKLLALTMANNCVVVALANSRIYYDGEAMGLSSEGAKPAEADAPTADSAEAPSFG